MDLVNVSEMTLVYSFYLGLFASILSFKYVAKIIKKSRG